MTARPLRVISLGAGVQSSAMALMFADGEFAPMPDCAIFADTQSEPQYVYDQLDWLSPRLSFPIYVVTRGSLKQSIYNSVTAEGRKHRRFAGCPFYTESESSKRGGMLRRQCTREYKVAPITKKIRELIGLKYRQRAPRETLVHQYIGISYDEAIRQKPSRNHWIEHSWPLVERGIRRLDCLDWMVRRGYPAPRKSACTFCPYHDDRTWRDMKADDPESWGDAVQMDEAIRDGVRGTKERLYIHRSLCPLARIDWDRITGSNQVDMFQDECEGLCGI